MTGNKEKQGKPRFDLIPPEAEEALADVLTMGAEKYGDRNWEKGLNYGDVLAALKRHLNAWVKGEKKDVESGLNPIDHVLCNAAFLVTFERRGTGKDNLLSVEQKKWKNCSSAISKQPA